MSVISALLLVLLFGVFGSDAGTGYQRTTTLDELRDIDSYVATGLPLFEHGFFVNTAQGPILVKAKEEGAKQNKPRLNPGYYSTLPRLIPEGYEGVSFSHFNLGSAIPGQPPAILAHHPQPIHTVFARETQQDAPAQFSHEIQQTAPTHFVRETQQNAPPQFAQEVPQNALTHFAPRSIFPEHPGPRPAQYRENQQYRHVENQQFRPLENRQYRPRESQQFRPLENQQYRPLENQQFRPQESQQYRPLENQQYRPLENNHFTPRQTETHSRQFIHHPQRRQDRFQSPVAQDTFQINNFLNADDEDDGPTSYQNMMIAHAHEPTSRQLIRNPTVAQTLDFEETLPENLRNPFYKDEVLASALAQESLPVEGETIVGEWDTTKIQKRKIADLLSAAGFLR